MNRYALDARSKLVLFALLFVAFLMPMLSHAQSVQWNTEYNGTLCAPGDAAQLVGSEYDCLTYVQDPNISVTEYGQVTNADTGQPIACGSTVPEGTNIEYTFPAHQSQDIDWFGTGYSFDSPYGDWSTGAAAVSSCVDKNYVGEEAITDSVTFNGSPYYSETFTAPVYADLPVQPPGESMSGTSGLGCTASGSGEVCNTPTAGTYDPVFNYGSTYGYFYGYYDSSQVPYAEQYYGECPGGQMTEATPASSNSLTNPGAGGETETMSAQAYDAGSTYTLQVPAQQISCPITVTGTATAPPNSPTANIDSGANSCANDNSPSYTISGSDSNPSAQVRYGISWDDSGTVEEWIPSTGYVTAGTPETVEQDGSASTFEVLTQDSSGNNSGWSTVQSTPCGAGVCPANEFSQNNTCVSSCSLGYVQQGNTCTFVACPQGYTLQNNACVATGCAVGPICQNGNLYMQKADCTVSSQPTESCSYGCSGSICLPPPLPEIASWKLAPTLVKSGQTTQVDWSATNVASCTIVGTNGDAWTGLTGTQTSKPITAQTIYTITCLGLPNASPASATDSATVNIVPNFQEQ